LSLLQIRVGRKKTMKKIISMILMILLLSGMACAGEVQTRESIVMVEGCGETITETLYESPQGFRIWYPADLFTVAHEEGSDCFETIPGFADAGVAIADVQTTSEYVDERMNAEVEKALANGAVIPVEAEEWQLENGISVKYAEIVYGDSCNPLYYLYGKGRVFCLSCYYPLEAAEGIGARIQRMISTFEQIEETFRHL